MANEENEMPVFSEKVSEAEQSLSMQDKMEIIDKEIRELYEFCKKSGYTQTQIENCAQPLLAIETRQKHITCLRILAYFVLFVAFIGFLFAYDPSYRKICIYGKQVAVKVIPYWDWTYIYDRECLIENPYYENPGITKEDCKVCQNLARVERLKRVAHEDVAQDFLLQDIPVVVGDATDSWLAKDKFNVDGILEMYQKSKVARESILCDFQCTVSGYSHPMDVLEAIQKGKVKPGWQIYWQNCEKNLGKVFRQLYKRPYFLPPMAEAGEGNWLFMSHGGTKVLNKAAWEGTATWIAQVHGSARVILKPNAICGSICRKLTVILKPGEILTVTSEMWQVTYKPVGEGLVAALGAPVNWDSSTSD